MLFPKFSSTFAKLALVLALVSTSALADDADTLSDLLDDFLAGASVNDPIMHNRFWADDLVYTSSSGARYGKQKILNGLGEPADPDAARSVYSADQLKIRILADDVAVVTFRLVATPPEGAVDYFLNTGVLQNRGGEWRASTWQATRVPSIKK